VAIVRELFDTYPNLTIIQTTGRGNEEALQTEYNRALSPKEISRVVLMGYTTELYRYSAAADIVVARAGANTMAELAVQHKPCIIIPNPVLTGGHQLKNVAHLEKDDAIFVVHEKDIANDKHVLFNTVRELLDNAKLRYKLGEQLGTYAKPEAAQELAQLIIKVGEKEYPRAV
jgi:UDP-N-acetylglucosamine--N-acetylmuramyl-(pentapeptide) pyrophosphoryl-undecaprenol N-acetylglucosamine transferase